VRDSIGLVYDAERFDAPHPPVFGRPLAVCPKNVMKYGEIKGVGKPVSRLIMAATTSAPCPTRW